ncbi:MAG: UDP-N-acetylmuramoyl-tripeptide--D-alanyl-D-alanine ligase [Thermoleophilaceae bacterium]|nr:UDP-N-acetylmuramoyl-tripeptide--D-alanyl-D-alanine ligase [Thermoleophilaceae bacterium]
MAGAAQASLRKGDLGTPGPRRAVIDTREVREGDLFVGVRGTRADGGAFAAEALGAGAWGVMVSREHVEAAVTAAPEGTQVLEVEDPLASLGTLAREWRRELGAKVIGVTGSTGKTSTKDILAAVLAPQMSTHASRENFNTEIGLPLAILEAQETTEALVLEMAMRGEGQIAELTEIAEPDVGVIVNVGPVHLELLGTVERVAAAKAELIRDLRPGAVCVVPAGEALLEEHLRDDIETVTFGPGGHVMLLAFERTSARGGSAEIEAMGKRVALDLAFDEPYNLLNTLAAVGAAVAVGAKPGGRVAVQFSSLRGEVVDLPGGVTVVNDCYNANPMSMRAALQHLAETPAQRRLAVLGTMAELGEGSAVFHHEIGDEAKALGIDVLVTVGEEATAYLEGFAGETYAAATPEEAGALLEEIAQPGDRVLVKGSRSVGLERILA